MPTPAATACSEGCTGFHPVPGDAWSEFGICRQPGSPWRGFPVRPGIMCPWFVARDYSVEKDGDVHEPEATQDAAPASGGKPVAA